MIAVDTSAWSRRDRKRLAAPRPSHDVDRPVDQDVAVGAAADAPAGRRADPVVVILAPAGIALAGAAVDALMHGIEMRLALGRVARDGNPEIEDIVVGAAAIGV